MIKCYALITVLQIQDPLFTRQHESAIKPESLYKPGVEQLPKYLFANIIIII